MKHIYHGTIEKGLGVIKPFKRFTPGGPELADQIPPRIYATYNPAYAVAHSFSWSSDDGVDIEVDGSDICLIVPKDKASVLEQPVYIYTLPDDAFTHTAEEKIGLTYHSESEVTPIGCQCFASVAEAMHHFGGIVKVQ